MAFNFIFYADENFKKNGIVYYFINNTDFNFHSNSAINSFLQLLLKASRNSVDRVEDSLKADIAFSTDDKFFSFSFEVQNLKYKILNYLLKKNIKFKKLTKAILSEINFDYLEELIKEKDHNTFIEVADESSDSFKYFKSDHLMYSRNSEVACVSNNFEFISLCNIALFDLDVKKGSSIFKSMEDFLLEDNELLVTTFFSYFDSLLMNLGLDNLNSYMSDNDD